jgi:flavin-dependent thymidylate synthase
VPSEAATEPSFRSDVSVELVRASAQDADVLFAARVSTKGEQSLEDVGADATRSQGLINYLMRDRHGCYDEATEVLTGRGWICWADARETDWFATLSSDGSLEYQRPLRLVSRRHDGDMVRVRTAHVDLLVTPDHRTYAKRRRQTHREEWALVPATDLFQASHRLCLGDARWKPEWTLQFTPSWFALLGLFIGDGHSSGSTPVFRLRKDRETGALMRWSADCGFTVTRNGDRFYLRADEDFRLFAKRCYAPDGAKVVPADVLACDRESLLALLDGLMASDGSVSASGTEVYTTTSPVLAGQVQELALKVGRAASVRRRDVSEDAGHVGRRPVYYVCLFRPRRATPRVGWTTADRRREVTLRPYRGTVYCATVPNGTLYVRRNGKALWCGNSPFEHNSMTFYVQAPIFVFREFMRHRIASYNEESGRYRELRPVFYVPGRERRLVQEGKPGRYVFVDGTPEQHALVEKETRVACEQAYAAYQRMLDAGIAREVARIVLPLTIYSSMYVTMNARSLMNFLSLRTTREDSTFPSFPQREIEMVAEQMEQEWARLMPLTHAAFDANGRVAP